MNKFFKHHKILLPGIAIIALIAIITSVYFYLQYQKSQIILQNPTLAAQQETKNLIDRVGHLIELPTNEQPTIAIVSDVNQLKDRAFFANAKNGDKVLIYTRAKKAILYDPLEGKIIEVGPITIGTTNITPTQSPAPSIISVVLYNGTTTVGLTSKIESQLKKALPNITVVDKSNASKTDYTNTFVIDLKGNQASMASQLANILHGTVSPLPTGETAPANADILVILGK